MLGAKIAGATTTEIARQEGLNRDWVRQELASNECQQIIICLVQRRLREHFNLKDGDRVVVEVEHG